MTVNRVIWLAWLVSSLALVVYLARPLITEQDRSMYLIGETTHGHHQIEMACNACHTSAFGGPEVIQSACIDCHGEELELAKDSHPKTKFSDPRNADRIDILDARYCVTCHKEHNEEIAGDMGLTLPEDYCFRCHEDIGEERETHKDLPFDSCASAGCHNYHDNLALYEDFLLKHADEPDFKHPAVTPARTKLATLAAVRNFAIMTSDQVHADVALDAIAGQEELVAQAHHDWSQSQHAHTGVNCLTCHAAEEGEAVEDDNNVTVLGLQTSNWVEKPSYEVCQKCHTDQVDGFLLGKHGMRLAHSLSPMKVSDAKIMMKTEAGHEELDCMSCHSAHRFDTVAAATDSCLTCHDSEHVNNYWGSPHGKLQQEVLAGVRATEEGVTCATCHMPRIEVSIGDSQIVMVNHNQNENLRPNEKMIRPVCMKCHSLEFSIDALADDELIESNFTGQPQQHIRSIDMALERDAKTNRTDKAY